MSVRGFLHFGGHHGLLFIMPEPEYYGGERHIFDIGETDRVGVLRTGGGDRQVHPLCWYAKYPRVKKALAANQEKRRTRPKVGLTRPKLSLPRPSI